MDKKVTVLLLFMVIFISGCTAKLSDKKESFEAEGIAYTIQLPSTWETTADVKVTYSNEAVLGAQDTQSNSTLIVMGERKESIELSDFGTRMRKELQKQYNYKEASDIFMKEFKVGKYKGYKYTIDTVFDKRESWLHLYYVETAHGLIQMNFYSAKDGNYEKRAEIIDSSVQTVKETKDNGKEEKDEGTIVFENDDFVLELTGVMNLAGADKESILALRYTVTNKGEQEITPEKWDQLIQVKQNNERLQAGTLAKDNAILDIPKLMKQKDQKMSKGESLEGVSLYELTDGSNVILTPSEEVFTSAEEVPLVIEGTEKGDESQ